MSQRNKLNFSGQAIFVGIDVHKKSWKVAIYTEDFEHKAFSQDPVPEKLAVYLKRNFPCANYYSVYEAGFCGFWIHRELRALGIKNIVVNPADVPTKHKERRRKSDRIDCRKLARSLRSGELTPIHVPSRESLEDRFLVRARKTLVIDQTRYKNQIKGALSFYGIDVPERFQNKNNHWSNNFIKWLEKEATKEMRPSGEKALKAYIIELKHKRKRLVLLNRDVRALAGTLRYHKWVTLLISIPGIGVITAMILLTEIDGILDRFRSLDRLASFIGIVPDVSGSGDKSYDKGITKRGHNYLRQAIIEAAWTAARKDPALTMAFNELTKRMKKNQAIIRIARKLLRRIRYVLRYEQSYLKGVVE